MQLTWRACAIFAALAAVALAVVAGCSDAPDTATIRMVPMEPEMEPEQPNPPRVRLLDAQDNSAIDADMSHAGEWAEAGALIVLVKSQRLARPVAMPLCQPARERIADLASRRIKAVDERGRPISLETVTIAAGYFFIRRRCEDGTDILEAARFYGTVYGILRIDTSTDGDGRTARKIWLLAVRR